MRLLRVAALRLLPCAIGASCADDGSSWGVRECTSSGASDRGWSPSLNVYASSTPHGTKWYFRKVLAAGVADGGLRGSRKVLPSGALDWGGGLSWKVLP